MCCGGVINNRPQTVRTQIVGLTHKELVKAETPKQIVQRQIARRSAQPASIDRQYAIPRQQCIKCGYPTMMIHIGDRERFQCSNANCRAMV